MTAKRGFTLIEILVVLVVLGILAGLAIVRLQSQRGRGVVASMTADLHAVAEEQEAWYIEHRAYSPVIDSLNPRPSPGNVTIIHEGTATGWSGSASNPATAKRCYIYVGSAAPVGAASADGVINCS